MSQPCPRCRAYPAIKRLLFLIILATPIVPAGPAAAHDAPSGWAYDMSCCSNKDCHPEPSEVKATSFGWLVTATGETIPYNDRRIRESQDGDFHRCADGSARQQDQTRCLYVPPMGL